MAATEEIGTGSSRNRVNVGIMHCKIFPMPKQKKGESVKKHER